MVCGGLWCGLWWFVVVCGSLWWFVVFSATLVNCQKQIFHEGLDTLNIICRLISVFTVLCLRLQLTNP